jgi:hypothetical protein
VVEGAPFPRPSHPNELFGSFDARMYEPQMLQLEKLGRKGQSKL